MLLQVLTLRSRAASAGRSKAQLRSQRSTPTAGQRLLLLHALFTAGATSTPLASRRCRRRGGISAARRSMSWKGHQVQFGAPIGLRPGEAIGA